MTETCVSLDIETTGLDPEMDEIIEIGAVKFTGNEVVDTFQSFVNPGRQLPYRIQVLCGIGQPDVDEAPLFAELTGPLRSFVQDCPIVGHNVPFDLGFLQQKGCGFGNTTYDTYELAILLLFQQPDYSLATLAARQGLSIPEHRAVADALAAKELFLALVQRASELDIATLEESPFLTKGLEWKARTAFSGDTRPQRSTSDETHLWREDGERREPHADRTRLDVDDLSRILDADGLLAQALPGYEHRPGQIRMMKAVAEAFNDGEQLIVEAGTGTGKSIAYLLPSIFFSTHNDLPVVISTNTINLQDQLMAKDIPDLMRALELRMDDPIRGLKAVQLKGRSNYLCRRRYESLSQSDGLTLEEAKVLARIRVWLSWTRTGDRSELSMSGNEFGTWSKMCAQLDERVEARCPHRQRGTCFLHQARKTAESAHVILVNHALLLSDLVAEGRILPPYDHLVIDEAHHLEDEATSQLGFEADQWELFEYLGRFRRETGGQRPTGLIPTLNDCFRGSNVAPSRQRQTRELAESLDNLVHKAHDQMSQFLGKLRDVVENHASDRGDYERHVRLTPSARAQPGWSSVEIIWEDLSMVIGDIADHLDQLYTSLADLDDNKVVGYDHLMTEVPALLSKGNELRCQIGSLVSQPEPEGIYWLAMERQTGAVGLHIAPLSVGALLEKSIFSSKESVILTGATLSTENTFEHIKGRLGLLYPNELMLESPFDYLGSTMVYLPDDIPDPGRPGYQEAVQELLLDVCQASRGRTLGLFTSHAALRATHAAIQAPLEEEGILVMGQGVSGSPKQLVAALKANPDTAVLGASSLWEGIDIVGEALSVLVIAKLPFNVPTDPVFAARCEMFDDPFNEYGIPQAAIRFKQGFGRLIRSRNDRGVVVVVDRRVQSKKYGSAFMESIPLCTVVRGPSHRLPDAIRGWLDRPSGSIPGEKPGSAHART
jgi:DNA polymerase-3 subunit epsilon/ATP-dependent DNA helicase DinG